MLSKVELENPANWNWESIEAEVRASGLEVRELGTIDYGYPVLAVRLCKGKTPAAIIKAGSHTSELGAIAGALSLLRNPPSCQHEVWLIVVASPFDFCGYEAALSKSLDRELVIESSEGCLEILETETELLDCNKDFRIYLAGNTGFVWLDVKKIDPRALAYGQLDEYLKSRPKVIAALGGKRVFLPSKLLFEEGLNSFGIGGLTAWVHWTGWAGNSNRFWDSCNPPAEVALIRDFCESLDCQLAIDMHELATIEGLEVNGQSMSGSGYGEKYCLILPPVHGPKFEEWETPIAEAAIRHAARSGFEAESREVLASNWGFGDNSFHNGYLRSNQLPILAFYQWAMRYNASIVVETGMNQPVSRRGAIQYAVVSGALTEFERINQHG